MTMTTTKNGQRFEGGRLLVTPGVLSDLDPTDVNRALARHFAGDWGECCPEDWQENDLSIDQHFRLFSVYRDRQGVKFWIITEADRSATTVLLPSEY